MPGSKKIWIGTSNIVVPGNKQSFPVAFQHTSRLRYYSHLFNTVELNSTFYKTPLLSTYQRWQTEVPEDFRFSIKLSKNVTHVKDLAFEIDDIIHFMKVAAGIGRKKGCLLVQFPGKISLDHFARLEHILQLLDTHNKGRKWNIAFEFRNLTWYVTEMKELLDYYQAGLVLHDKLRLKMDEPITNAKFVYLRFHGPAADYRGSYDTLFLQSKAALMRNWVNAGKDVYVYFNNTIGNAFENAMTLRKMLKNQTVS